MPELQVNEARITDQHRVDVTDQCMFRYILKRFEHLRMCGMQSWRDFIIFPSSVFAFRKVLVVLCCSYVPRTSDFGLICFWDKVLLHIKLAVHLVRLLSVFKGTTQRKSRVLIWYGSLTCLQSVIYSLLTVVLFSLIASSSPDFMIIYMSFKNSVNILFQSLDEIGYRWADRSKEKYCSYQGPVTIVYLFSHSSSRKKLFSFCQADVVGLTRFPCDGWVSCEGCFFFVAVIWTSHCTLLPDVVCLQ